MHGPEADRPGFRGWEKTRTLKVGAHSTQPAQTAHTQPSQLLWKVSLILPQREL